MPATVLRSTLLQPILDSSLARGRGLREGRGPAKWAGGGPVAHAHDADVTRTADGRIARHARRHLHRDGEVGVGRQGQAREADPGDVLRDLGRLEGRRVRAARRAVDRRLHGPRPVLVDLPERHGDGPVVRGGRQPARGALARRRGDVRLRRRLRLVPCCVVAVVFGAAEQARQEAAEAPYLFGAAAAPQLGLVDVVLDAGGVGRAVVRGRGRPAHEVLDHRRGVDQAVALGPPERADLALLDLAVPDDGGVGLRPAPVAGAIPRGPVGD